MRLTEFARHKIIKITIIIIIISSLSTNARRLKKEIKNFYKNKIDVAVQYEKKFYPIKKLIPYGEDIGLKNDETDFGEFAQSMYLTQYSLSPNKLLLNKVPDYVVTIFNDSSKKAQFIKKNKLNLIQNIDDKTDFYERARE